MHELNTSKTITINIRKIYYNREQNNIVLTPSKYNYNGSMSQNVNSSKLVCEDFTFGVVRREKKKGAFFGFV